MEDDFLAVCDAYARYAIDYGDEAISASEGGDCADVIAVFTLRYGYGLGVLGLGYADIFGIGFVARCVIFYYCTESLYILS